MKYLTGTQERNTQMNEPNHTSECQCAFCSAKRVNNVNEPSVEQLARERFNKHHPKGDYNKFSFDELWHHVQQELIAQEREIQQTLAETVEPLKARNEHLEKLSHWCQCEYALKVKERDAALERASLLRLMLSRCMENSIQTPPKIKFCKEALEYIKANCDSAMNLASIRNVVSDAIAKLNEGK